ncbi:uncharacterized protein LOC114310605 [Camellia sinensis]|uniref:uncharacterized protein LOC114310605 n=1 Tax=Camellia sinensis TaxID=4442 RepID=UPI0010356065|nr:uncharacterized protein LOC114310605 [Camellia sinensis]
MPEKENSRKVVGSNNDRFLVHHSDSPTAVLVSPLLSRDNYGTWIHAMTMVLRTKNKIGFVDESIEQPKDFEELHQWERCNDLVGSWILNSIGSKIHESILYAETVREISLDLCDRFIQTNALKIYQLKQSIAKTKRETHPTYFTKMKVQWDERSSICTV